jgi:hypothetical protein
MTTGASLPSAMRVLGWCVVPGAWFWALRLAWEATVLTMRHGPQMIGFSFVHTSPLALPLIVSALLAEVWVVLAIAWVGYAVWRKLVIDRRAWIQLGIVAMPVVIRLLIPAIT